MVCVNVRVYSLHLSFLLTFDTDILEEKSWHSEDEDISLAISATYFV